MSDPLQRLAALAGTISSSALRVLNELTAKPDQSRQSGRLGSFILDVLQMSGVRKLEGSTDGCRCQPNPPAVIIDDVAALPEDYVRYIQRTEPGRAMIARSLKTGAAIPGCRLKQTMRLVRT